MAQMVTAEADKRARWLPSPGQIRIAQAMITEAARAGMCIDPRVAVPIAQPGKSHGVWTVGQAVEHPPGFWLVDSSSRSDGGAYDYSRGRNAASHAADVHLGERPGTVGYVIIDEAGHAAVFEDFRGLS